MSFEGTLREEFMAGRELGLEQGINMIRESLNAVFEANQNNPLSREIVTVVIDTCIEEIGRANSGSTSL